MEGNFHTLLKQKAHVCIKKIYTVSNTFPKEEKYGVTSQIRRAAISIMLNYTEGYARFKPKVKLNFFQISYGSLQEVKYLIFFAKDMSWLEEAEYQHIHKQVEEISRMLWATMEGLKRKHAI